MLKSKFSKKDIKRLQKRFEDRLKEVAKYYKESVEQNKKIKDF